MLRVIDQFSNKPLKAYYNRKAAQTKDYTTTTYMINSSIEIFVPTYKSSPVFSY